MSENLRSLDVILKAAANGEIEIVREHLDKRKNLNAQGVDGRTLLINACANGHSDIIKLLLESGADAKLASNTGQSALSCTLANVFAYAVPGKKGGTPAMGIVTVLTSRGCPVHKGDIISATWFQSAEVVSHLLKRFTDKKALAEAADHAEKFAFEYDLDENQLEVNLALVRSSIKSRS